MKTEHVDITAGSPNLRHPVLAKVMSRCFAIVGAFCAITIWHIGLGVVTPGDVYGRVGGPLPGWLFLMALAGGFFAGEKARFRLRIVIILLAVASVCYWAFAPSGWWVKRPPSSRYQLRSSWTVGSSPTRGLLLARSARAQTSISSLSTI